MRAVAKLKVLVTSVSLCVMAPAISVPGGAPSSAPVAAASNFSAPENAVGVSGAASSVTTCYSCIYRDPWTIYCDTYQNGDTYGPYTSCNVTVVPCEGGMCDSCNHGDACTPILETPVAALAANGAIAFRRGATGEEGVQRSCNGFVVARAYSAAEARGIAQRMRVLSL